MTGGVQDRRREASALRGLAWAWDRANAYYLKGAMRPPNLELMDDQRLLGAWVAATRTIRVDRRLAVDGPWHQAAEVLRHEMAHQFVAEVLGVVGERSHGPAFATACDRLGVDAVAAGLSEAPGPLMPARMETIRKLLALATSPSRHEAESAARAAQRMLGRYNMDLADLDVGPHAWTARRIGPVKVRFARWERMLVGLLGEHFFVRVVWVPVWLVDRGRAGRAVEALGRPDNLDMAGYVLGFVHRTALQLWSRQRGARRDRMSFLCGVIAGFEQGLRRQRESEEERGLVWVGEAGLDEFVGRRYPALRTRRGRSAWVTRAYGRGVAAGGDIVLRRPITADPGHSRSQIEVQADEGW